MDEECVLQMQNEEDGYSSTRGRVTHSEDVRAADAGSEGCNDCSMDQQCDQSMQSKEDDNENVHDIAFNFFKVVS